MNLAEHFPDVHQDGGLLGTIGRDGSQGTFHLKVFAAPMEQAVEPRRVQQRSRLSREFFFHFGFEGLRYSR